MNLSEFTYDFSQELIAQYPLARRDQARLMVIDRTQQTIRHDIFANLGCYLPPQSLIVLNDSKVVPARLLGKRQNTGGVVEIFLLKNLPDGYSYQALLRPLKRLKDNEKIIFNGGSLIAEIKDCKNRIVRFNKKNITRDLNRIGHIPLPPYIKRPDEKMDRIYYQTVFAKKNGSIASPTAGLHFTKPLLTKLKRAGHKVVSTTLHINHATFKSVETQDVRQHPMHYEDYELSSRNFQVIQKAKRAGKKIAAVGTTSCRVLETVAIQNMLKGSTNLFIYPGFDFKMTDCLITNFHLPYTTLLMLVFAFGGTALMKRAYREAILKKYRFFSYGDAMIII